MKNECIEAVQRELEPYGIKSEIIQRGKHIEVAWQYEGQAGSVVVAATPSDRRAALNSRAEARRQLRQQNAQLPAAPIVSIQKAFQLPRPEDHGAVRLATLEKDFGTLLDIVSDLGEQTRMLTEHVVALEQRLGSIRIVFGEAPALPVAVESSQKAPTAAAVPSQGKSAYGNRVAAVRAALSSGTWVSLDEIQQATGLGRSDIGAALSYMKTKLGTVENGLRGLWRNKPAEPIVEAVAATA